MLFGAWLMQSLLKQIDHQGMPTNVVSGTLSAPHPSTNHYFLEKYALERQHSVKL